MNKLKHYIFSIALLVCFQLQFITGWETQVTGRTCGIGQTFREVPEVLMHLPREVLTPFISRLRLLP
jgi:hypothetical protein